VQYFLHFLKFTSGFALILALALVALQITGGLGGGSVASVGSGW